jgi:predicted nucleic acid-binding protein
MRKFLSAFVWIEMDHAIAEETGKLIANRLEAGKPVDFQDNVILATCIQQKADYLLTENLKHFRSKEMETKVFTTSQFLKQLKKEK